jgi:beta-lactamase class A
VVIIRKVLCLLAFIAAGLWHGAPAAGAGAAVDYEPLREELTAYLDGRAGEHGFFFVDLGTGTSIGYNARDPFHGASTFKVPLNLYLFREIAAGRVNPDLLLVYRKAHYEGGTGCLREKPFGSAFRIGRLARDSIVYSDNVAANMLLGHLGRSNVVEYMRGLGATAASDQANVTCAEDLALYFRAVLEFAREHPEHGEQLLGHLRNTVYRDRIPAALPPGASAAHKTGDWPAQGSWHDGGIVEHPQRPYIVVVLSKNVPGYAYACATIREISRRVYAYQDDPFYRLTAAVDGRPFTLSGALKRDGRFFVPVRSFVELLPGYAVQWLPDERAVRILEADREILRLDGDSRLALHKGRSYLPLRQIGEELGYAVSWDASTATVQFSKPTPYPIIRLAMSSTSSAATAG